LSLAAGKSPALQGRQLREKPEKEKAASGEAAWKKEK
jgi:hypothetical protein